MPRWRPSWRVYRVPRRRRRYWRRFLPRWSWLDKEVRFP